MPNSVTEKKNRTVFYHLIAILIVSIWGATLVNTKVVIQGGMRPDEVFLARYIIAYLYRIKDCGLTISRTNCLCCYVDF